MILRRYSDIEEMLDKIVKLCESGRFEEAMEAIGLAITED